jgi:hypothetical protein
MIVDYHAHLYHPSWYPERFTLHLAEDFLSRRPGSMTTDAARAMVVRTMSDRSGTVTLRTMDKVGVDHRVLLIVDWGLELGEPELDMAAIHREILDVCARSNGRLIGFAGIDPRRERAPEIVKHAFDDLGARGLKLHPTGAWSLSDERTHAVVALAVERRLPVLVHVGATMPILNETNAHPHAFLALANAFPDGTFVAGHSGYDLCRLFVEASDRCRNVMFDISGWQHYAHKGEERLRSMLGVLSNLFAGRICFGSDSPFFTYNLAASEQKWINEVRALAPEVLAGPAALRDLILGTGVR